MEKTHQNRRPLRYPWIVAAMFFLTANIFCGDTWAVDRRNLPKMTRSLMVEVYSPLKPHPLVGVLKPHTPVKVLVTFAPPGFTEVLVQDEFLRQSRVLVRTRDLVDAPIEVGGENFDSLKLAKKRANPGRSSQHKKIENPVSVGAGLSGYSSALETRIQVSGDLRYLWNISNEALFGVDLTFGSKASLGIRAGERYYFWPETQLRPYVHGGIRVFNVKSFRSSAFDPGFGIQFVHSKGAFVELGANFLWATPFEKTRPNMWLFGGASGLRF